MPLTLNSTGGGSVTLDSGSTANNTTLTLPGVNGTVATTDGTNTTFTSITDSGNLTFTGTGNRITGDFSNAKISNRVLFQTSTANSASVVGVLPNGTGTITQFAAYGGSDPTNAQVTRIDTRGGTESRIESTYVGTPTSGTFLPMTFVAGGSERMRIDTSGNLGLGVTPSAWNSDYRALEILGYGTGLAADNYNVYTELLNNAYGSARSTFTYKSSFGATRYSQQRGVHAWYTAPSGTAGNAISFTQAMTLTAGGELYIAGTTDQGAYNLQCNGTGVWGAGAYVNGSDARLKEEVTDIDSGLDVVAAMRPVTFRYKTDYSKDQSTQPGFIAQELQAAMEGKNYIDGVVQSGPEYLNVAYQNLIPILTKAIQELKDELDDLKAKVQA